MLIRQVTDSDHKAWDEYVFSHTDGLAYHRFAWKEAVRQAYGFDDVYLLAEQDDSICGVLPMIDFNLPFLGRSLISLPYCDVAGVLADGADVASALLGEAHKMAQVKKVKTLELRSEIKDSEGDVCNDTGKVRMVLDLPEGSQVLLDSLKSKLRSQVNKPKRDGLTATLGGADLLDVFYPVFCENMRDLGSPVHSRKWIRSILLEFDESARVGIVYTPDGTPAAAGIILLHRNIVSIPWASSLRRFNHWNPNMLLYWTFLAFAADAGYERFDFGRSSPGEGTYKFKKQWGAKPVPLFWRNLLDDEMKLSVVSGRSRLRTLAEVLWRKLPLWVCNILGPRVRRYVKL